MTNSGAKEEVKLGLRKLSNQDSASSTGLRRAACHRRKKTENLDGKLMCILAELQPFLFRFTFNVVMFCGL